MDRPQQKKQKNTELKITEPCHLIKTKPSRGQCLLKYQLIEIDDITSLGQVGKCHVV